MENFRHKNRDPSHGYMWVLSNRVGTVYEFEPTRSGKVPIELLKNYNGAIVCDAYGGYNKVKKETNIRAIQNCLAHARREFYECYEDYPKEPAKMIRLIDRLFAIEATAKSLEFGQSPFALNRSLFGEGVAVETRIFNSETSSCTDGNYRI